MYIHKVPWFDGSFKHLERAGKLISNLYRIPSVALIYSKDLFKHLSKHGYIALKFDSNLFIRHYIRADPTKPFSVSGGELLPDVAGWLKGILCGGAPKPAD